MKGLNTLYVLHRLADESKWIELLSVSKLNRIVINSVVEMKYLNAIAEHCSKHLYHLEVNDFTDGGWILRLKYLKQFKSKCLLDLELFKSMVKQLAYLNKVEFFDIYKVDIKDPQSKIQFSLNNLTVLSEPKSVFLRILDSISFYSDLFNLEFLSEIRSI